jgi:hypothetical protein
MDYPGLKQERIGVVVGIKDFSYSLAEAFSANYPFLTFVPGAQLGHDCNVLAKSLGNQKFPWIRSPF